MEGNAFTTIVAIAGGGGIGAVLRYYIANLGQSYSSGDFPLGTFLVNIVGCALIGVVTALLIGPLSANRELLRLFIIVGVLGGFTTFSTFGLETFELFEDGRIRQAILYVALSNCVGILAAYSFYRIGIMLFKSTPS